MFKKVLRKAVNLNRKVLNKVENELLIDVKPHDFGLVKNNIDLVNKYKGQSCFIIGCGPSVKSQNLAALSEQNVIALSTLFYHEDYDKLKPLANIFTGYTFHNDIHEPEYFITAYKEINKYADGMLFFEEHDNEFIKSNNFFQNKEVRYYKALLDIENIDTIEPEIDKFIYAGKNIAIFAIQIAISLGFEKIYLLGLDHDWILKFQSKEYTKFKTDKDVIFNNTGITDFKVDGHDTFSFWLSVYHKLWSDYNLIKKLIDKRNVSVTNLTNGGILDVFEKNSLENILSQTS